MTTEENQPSAPVAGSSQSSSPEPGMSACRGCNKQVHRTAAVCPHCGISQQKKGYKSKGIAAVLAFFTGSFGVHRFYLGQWWGLFYLLFFWTCIPAIISFIEMIVFLASDQGKWDDKYNQGRASTGTDGGSVATVIIAIVAVLFVGVFVLGILAAIAIPSFQSYTNRARAIGGITSASMSKQLVEMYYIENGQLPDENEDIDFSMPASMKYVDSIDISEGGVITVVYDDSLENQTIVFMPTVSDEAMSWDCTGGTLESSFRPPECK